MTHFKPMLAGTCTDVTKLNYPVLVSPKLDGIRALVIDGVLVSRNLKPIPNKVIQSRYGYSAFDGLDGELIAGDPIATDCFRQTSSRVMSHEGDALGVKFHLFDMVPPQDGGNYPFEVRRLRAARDQPTASLAVPHQIVQNPFDLSMMEERYLAEGYEGLMIRDPYGPYKHGRSTEREGWLLKLKRFEDAEAEVVGVEELMHNGNAATQDALGRTVRSSHKAGKIGRGTLGALVVLGLNGPYAGAQFNVGTGFNDALRRTLWLNPPLNQIVKYRFFPSGSKDAPRFPVFVGFRDQKDMS